MSPAVPIIAGVAAIVAWSLFRTAKAVIGLNYNVVRLGIYRFNTDGNLILRLRIRFTNTQNTPLTVNLIDIAAYLNSVTYTDQNGKTQVSSRGDMIASLIDPSGFVIAANNFTEKEFRINVRWADIGRYFLTNAVSIISTIINANSISAVVRAIVGSNVLIAGVVKAENISVPISQVVQLQNDMQQ